jgi:hypothetical protein
VKQQNHLLPSLLSFLKHPTPKAEEKRSFTEKIGATLKLLSWSYALIIPLGLAVAYLLEYLNYDGVNSVQELIKSEDLLNVIILATVIGPVIEESIFRLSLRFNPFFLALATFLSIKMFAVEIPIFNLSNNENFQWLFAIVSSLLVYTLFASPKVYKWTENLYQTKYIFIFYFLTITFGYVHIFNYSEIQTLFPALIFLAIPQIIVGMMLGYMRINYGFLWSTLFHALYNLVIVIPALLTLDKNPELLSYGLAAAAIFLLIFIYGIITLIQSTINLLKK